jgi:hypothetical protein
MSKQFKISEEAVKQLVEFVENNLVTKLGRPILAHLEASLQEIPTEGTPPAPASRPHDSFDHQD